MLVTQLWKCIIYTRAAIIFPSEPGSTYCPLGPPPPPAPPPPPPRPPPPPPAQSGVRDTIHNYKYRKKMYIAWLNMLWIVSILVSYNYHNLYIKLPPKYNLSDAGEESNLDEWGKGERRGRKDGGIETLWDAIIYSAKKRKKRKEWGPPRMEAKVVLILNSGVVLILKQHSTGLVTFGHSISGLISMVLLILRGVLL